MKAALLALVTIALSSGNAANAETTEGVATPKVMPNPSELVNTRTHGKKRPAVVESTVSTKALEGAARPTASVYGGPAIAAKPKSKRRTSEDNLMRKLPGELPAGSPIPDSTQ